MKKTTTKGATRTRTRRSTFGDDIISRLQEVADVLERGDDLQDHFTGRTYRLDVRPTPHDPKLVLATRKVLGLSQALFARFIGVSPRTVQGWELGVGSPPSEMACRFLDEIRLNPEYWRRRLRQVAKAKSQ